MLGQRNTKADKYLRRHDTKKKWLSIMLCVALLTGTVSMYILNKPATAMTEDGAESIGVVMDTANAGSADVNADNGSSFWEPIPEDELPASNTEADSSENADAENTENAGEASDNEDATAADSSEAASDAAAAEGSESADATTTSEDAAAAEGSESADATTTSEDAAAAGDTSETASEDAAVATSDETQSAASDSADTSDSKVKESEDASDITDEIPESVDLAEYVTETIFERHITGTEDEWEVVEENEINEGDLVRITLVYKLPKEAKVSEDIYFDIPEEYGIVDVEKNTLDDNTGEYEVTEDNKVKITYNDDVKEEIIKEIEENNSEEETSNSGDSAFINGLQPFFRDTYAAFSNVFLLKVHAAENDGEQRVILYATRGASNESVKIVIDKVTIEKQENGNWIEIGSDDSGEEQTNVDDVSIKNGDILRFFMDYTVPRGTLDSTTKEGRTIEGYVPKSVMPLAEETGVVKNSAGAEVGTYTLGLDGKLTVIFTESFAKQNETHNIKSNFYFDGKFTIEKEGDDAVFKFSDNVVITVPVEKSEEEHDLSIKKTAEKNEANNEIRYTIVVSSKKGTTDVVTLNDKIEVRKQNYKGNQSVVKYSDYINGGTLNDIIYNGESVKNQYRINNYQDFTITLPKLSAGDKYELKYTLKYRDITENEHIVVKNTANAKSGSDDKTHERRVEFNPYPRIDKYGEYNGTEGTVKWTIVVHSDGKNLSGYQVRDSWVNPATGGSSYTALTVRYVTLTYPNGTQATGLRLPYTFPNGTYTAGDYIFTYDLPASEWLSRNRNKANNRAELWLGNEEVHEKKTEVIFPEQGTFNKRVGGGNQQNSILEITWIVDAQGAINRDKTEGSRKYWLYEDKLDKGYFTQESLSELQVYLRANFDPSAVVTPTYTGNAITGYTIKFYKDLSAGQTLTFSYKSYYEVSDGEFEARIKNTGTINNKKKDATYEHSVPYVKKYDYDIAVQTGDIDKASNEHNVKNFTDINGALSWGFMVNIPKNSEEGEYTIVDTLPGSVKLDDYGLAVSGDIRVSNPQVFGLTESKKSAQINYNNVVITAEVTDGTDKNDVVTIKIPVTRELMGKQLYFYIKGQIDNEYEWKGVDESGNPIVEKFDNKISLKDKNNEIISEDSYYEEVTYQNQIVKKTSSKPENDNIVSYKVEINKFAEDLLPESDELAFTDTLVLKYSTYEQKEIYADATLVPGSFKVTRVNDDGTTTELEHGTEYKYTTDSRLEDKTTGSDGYYRNYERIKTITMAVKDKQHLIIEYQYNFNGTEGLYIDAENTASLEGYADKSSSDKRNFEIQRSRMSADIDGVNLYKVDKLNEDIFLENAEFELSKWNGTTYELMYNFVTDSDGYYPLDGLEAGYAYRLKETKAPDNPETETIDDYYLADPYYFVLIDLNDLSSTTAKVPENFHGEELFKGATIYIKDLPKNIDISVEKEWGYVDNNQFIKEDNPNRSQIYVTLYKQYSSVPTDEKICNVTFTDHYYQSDSISQRGAASYISIAKGGKLKFIYTLNKNRVADITGFNLWDSNQSFSSNQVIDKLYAERKGNIVSKYGIKLESEGQLIEPAKEDISYDPSTYTATLIYYVTVNDDLNISGYGNYYDGVSLNGPIKIDGESSIINTNEQVVETIALTPSCNWEHTWSNLPRYYEDNGNLYYIDYHVKEGKPGENISENSQVNDYKLHRISYDYQTWKIVVTVQNELISRTVLPDTGSTGTMPFTVGGLVMLATAVVGTGLVNRKKREED
ncbi:LPXTG cell wall anchor domain-containing protein [Butyrivibrio sp. AE3006]|uniref:LPXTG cell wall anchor domain-containing protein n=1 Tax=Butyrivibrio sp. AE3006 TaxID=1280673 RepID=UPI000688DBC2|nr:LPXTG cell wall anchor domain-containing protein [Butyrivibrio sp. AE3006]